MNASAPPAAGLAGSRSISGTQVPGGSELPRRLRHHDFPLLLFALVAFGAVAALVWFLMRDRPLAGDESVHVRVIEDLIGWLRAGTPFVPSHPAIPGYHFVVAAVAALMGLSGAADYRAISVGLNLLIAPAALALARSVAEGDARLSTARAAEVFFLAIAFPFFGLLYTDLFSAALVLLCFALVFRERYAPAGLVGALSIAVRQNNVLWLGLAFVVGCVQLWRGFAEGASVRSSLRRATPQMLARLWPFLAGFGGFIAFVIRNGGQIALADQPAHPPFTFHLGNVWTVTFTAFFLFLPLGLARVDEVVRFCRRRAGAVWLGGVALASLYLVTFSPTHPYNFAPWWLHNKVVLLATASLGWKLVFLVAVLYQTLVFARTPLWRPELYLLYPVAGIYLAASWLIEPRYFIVPLMLFLLFREQEKWWVEGSLLAWNAAWGAVLFWGVYRGLWIP